MSEFENISNDRIVIKIKQFLKEMIPNYIDNRRMDIVNIKALIESSGFDDIKVLGHRMKGSGGGYGFDEISRIGKVIEEGAKGQKPQIIQESLDELIYYLDHLEIIYE